MSTAKSTPHTGQQRPGNRWPVLLCWIAVALDGFDLVVLGAVIPTIAKTQALGFTSASLTTAATVGLVGVGIGAIAIGPLTDRYGRRRCLIGCIAAFSLFTLAIAVAPNVATFVLLRFLAGLGLGACLPTALAFMSEHAGAGRGGTAVTRMMTGYHVGAVLTALVALWVIPNLGWQWMFALGGILGLASLPVMWAKLPESEAYLRVTQGEAEPARSTDVVRGAYRRISLGIWAASFMGLLLVYGLNTWLPTIMGQAGYSLTSGLTLLLVLNVGAVIGLLVAGSIADLRGTKATVLAWFGLAGIFLALLSIRTGSSLLVHAAVLAAGVFVFSAQVLVYAFVGHLYPPAIRGTALGMSAGVGRAGAIVGPYLGGQLVATGVAYPWGFYLFALAAAIAVLALATVPPAPARDHSGMLGSKP
ncbi:MFS transporter [Streptomyces scopuliridis]|uniref:MFS transporter n=1 Tax=Streptomyces scopuliridis TaxID=452529 RepID=UPI0034404204